jgi:NAD+ synthase (glutamine-hydrolysing)
MDKTTSLRIALAQINPTIGDFEGNITKIVNAIKSARKYESDIVTFPELAICGYPPEDLLFNRQFLQDNRDSLKKIVQQSEGITALIGFVDSQDDKLYNAAAVINNNHIVCTYYKVELPNYGVFDEKRYFSPGSECLNLELKKMNVLITICGDIWIEGGEVEKCAIKNNVSVVFNISASPFYAGKFSIRQEIVAGFAKRTKAFVCYNNLLGGQDELVFDGGNFIVSPQGKLLASAKRFEENLLLAEIEVNSVSPRSCFKLEKSLNNKTIVLASKNHERKTPIYNTFAPEIGILEAIYKALVLGTRDYILKNDFNKVLIGLSGGIDSSLTAAIAVDVLGESNVIGVTMPSQYTSRETLSDAEIIAKNLNIRLITVPVKDIFLSYLDELSEPFINGSPGIENENLQSRIRGNILMAISNRFRWLVLSTGNKSETAVGYCTLYGDIAGGFAVIKDVPKTMVYELADYVNKKANRDLIPRSILRRPPTAELRPDQKDEDSLPPYSILDPILKAYVEEDKSQDEIVKEGFDKKIVNEVIRMVDHNEYKRRQSPPGVRITPKAFGKDRRLPITSRYSK